MTEAYFLKYFSYLHELKIRDMLLDTFKNIYEAEGYEDAVCHAKADIQVERIGAKIEQFHKEVLDLTEEK